MSAKTNQLSVDEIVHDTANSKLAELEVSLSADVLFFMGPIVFGMDERVRTGIESLGTRRPRLAVILDTPGGIVEVVERMVHTIRHHYAEVVFVIPDRAMSAGTVFALSGDAIMMDYFSVLGPIDPQIQREKALIPAVGYLQQFEKLVEKAQRGELTTAEAMLISKLDLAELQRFEEARNLSVNLLKKWLVTYKFKDWTVRQTSGVAVTAADREERAESIAKSLSDPKKWNSHGRGIPMAKLIGDDLKLKIDDFGANPELSKLVREYFTLMRDWVTSKELPAFVHTREFF